MWQKLVGDSSFFLALLLFDRDLAEGYRGLSCRCGGRLHRAAYPRKPRGGPRGLPEGYGLRESFCCDRDGCRRRLTPPSLRFMGRRVYLGAVVLLISAMVHGITEKRAAEMRTLVGVSRRTLERWRKWWREVLVKTQLWKAIRGRFMPPVAEVELPGSVLTRIVARSAPDRVMAMLELLSPLTGGSNWTVAL